MRRLWHRPDWEQFAGSGWADRILTVAVTDRFHAKQGRSTGRWVLHGDGRRLAVYLKRHYRLPWCLGWLAALWPEADWSPALREWHHLERARRLGLPVPAAVAAGEFNGPWGRLQSFLAVEELTGMLPLHEAIPAAANHLAADDFDRWKRGLAVELARLARRLHDGRYFHKDLYLCHFYIPEEATRTHPTWRECVHVIDLHRLGRHPWTWRVWQVKDLAQLAFSSEIDGVEGRDRLRFWRAYLGAVRQAHAARWLRRLVLFKWRRYGRHNARTGSVSPRASGERSPEARG
jgi:heptose I phosphotransferase